MSAWLFEARRGESPDDAYRRCVEAALGYQPDIIVMDQQMPPITGAELIGWIRGASGRDIVFVGNSAAWPEPLNAVGAIGNMEKGRRIEPFIQALGRFGAKA